MAGAFTPGLFCVTQLGPGVQGVGVHQTAGDAIVHAVLPEVEAVLIVGTRTNEADPRAIRRNFQLLGCRPIESTTAKNAFNGQVFRMHGGHRHQQQNERK